MAYVMIDPTDVFVQLCIIHDGLPYSTSNSTHDVKISSGGYAAAA